MTSTTDPNQVRLTGENSFIRLSTEQDGQPTTNASHWRVLLSPTGTGHALFLKSDLTGGELRVYSDNIALARWLQKEIEGSMRPDYNDPSIPVIEAEFSSTGDARSFWTERIESDEDAVSLTWYDFGEPFVMAIAPGSTPGQPHGIYSCLVPAHGARVSVDGEFAPGRPFPNQRNGRESSTACLAFSETWVRPYSEV